MDGFLQRVRHVDISRNFAKRGWETNVKSSWQKPKKMFFFWCNCPPFLRRTCSVLTAICPKKPKNFRRQMCHFAPRPLLWLKTPKKMLLGKNFAVQQRAKSQDLLSWCRTGSKRRSKPERSFSTQPQFNPDQDGMNSLHAIILKGSRAWMIGPRKSVK